MYHVGVVSLVIHARLGSQGVSRQGNGISSARGDRTSLRVYVRCRCRVSCDPRQVGILRGSRHGNGISSSRGPALH
jgi:hypothetical protein